MTSASPSAADHAPAPEGGAPQLQVVTRLDTPSLLGVVRLMAIVSGCVGAVYLLYLTRGVVKILAIAGFTAMSLGPVVDAVQRLRLPRAWAIVAVYASCFLAIAGVGALLVPSISSQGGRFSREAQHGVTGLRDNATFRRYDDRYHITPKAEAQLRELPSHLGDAAGPLRDVTVGAIGFASSLIAVLSVAFLLILNGEGYVRGTLSALPPSHATRWRRVAPRIYAAVSGYVIGNLKISLIAGFGAWVAMTAIGIPFALPLAIVVAFFDLLPMVGATLAALVVALAALLVSPLAAAVWLVYAFAYQQVENYLIQPMVYRQAVHVSALTTIVSVLIGGTLLGLLGALLAIPAAAAIQLIVEDLRHAGAETA
jgi:predicted PurR-regulated permease PerM